MITQYRSKKQPFDAYAAAKTGKIPRRNNLMVWLPPDLTTVGTDDYAVLMSLVKTDAARNAVLGSYLLLVSASGRDYRTVGRYSELVAWMGAKTCGKKCGPACSQRGLRQGAVILQMGDGILRCQAALTIEILVKLGLLERVNLSDLNDSERCQVANIGDGLHMILCNIARFSNEQDLLKDRMIWSESNNRRRHRNSPKEAKGPILGIPAASRDGINDQIREEIKKEPKRPDAKKKSERTQLIDYFLDRYRAMFPSLETATIRLTKEEVFQAGHLVRDFGLETSVGIVDVHFDAVRKLGVGNLNCQFGSMYAQKLKLAARHAENMKLESLNAYEYEGPI